MRLKSQQSTNQWIKTCVTNIFLVCLLTTKVLAYVTSPGFAARQLLDKREVHYDDDDDLVTNPYHQPHFTGNRSVIVQLFEWKFVDIAEECRLFLGPQGYAGVQLSPVLEHTVVKSSDLNHPWWERYEVISYRLASRSGDESEFWSMSRICNDNGVRIYADVILNHMAAPLHFLDSETTNKDFIVNTLLETNVNISNLNYPNVSYTREDFHRPCAVEHTHDAYEIRNCQLNGHPDLHHSRATVQQHIVEMLNKFIDMGVAGFRIDTAKYLWPMDLKHIYEQVKDLNQEFHFAKNTKPFFYQDVFDMGLDTISKTEYSTYGVVSEYLYPAELSIILNGKAPLSSLINWGPAMGFLAHQDSLVFVDSHDTQRGLPNELGRNRMLTYKQRIKYIMANAFMLAHPYGNIKRIMSSYYYAEGEVNQGPPVEEEDDNVIRSPKFNAHEQCTFESGWVCEHRWPPLVNMVKVANYFRVPGQGEESIVHFQTNGPNQIAFCRGNKLFVAMNNDPEMDFSMEVYTCLEPGIYCDIITGGKKQEKQACHGKQLEVNEQGFAKLVVPVADGNDEDYGGKENEMEDLEEEEPNKVESYGILVVYVGSKIDDNEDQTDNQNLPEESLKEEDDLENGSENDSQDNVSKKEDKEEENETTELNPNQQEEDSESVTQNNPKAAEDNLEPEEQVANEGNNGVNDIEDGTKNSEDQSQQENADENDEQNADESADGNVDELKDQPESENEVNDETQTENDVEVQLEENESEIPAEDQLEDGNADKQPEEIEEEIEEEKPAEDHAEENDENSNGNESEVGNPEEIIEQQENPVEDQETTAAISTELPEEIAEEAVEDPDQDDNPEEEQPDEGHSEENNENSNGNELEVGNSEEIIEQQENPVEDQETAEAISNELSDEIQETAIEDHGQENHTEEENTVLEVTTEPQETNISEEENINEEKINSEQNEAENIDVIETAEDNIEHSLEEQAEKPSAEIIKELNTTNDPASGKTRDIQKAGIFSKSAKDGNNG